MKQQLLKMARVVTSAALLVGACIVANEASAQTIALQAFSGGILVTSGSDQTYGWEFDALSPITVTALGVGENDGPLNVSHDVGIFQTSSQDLLASTTLPAGGGTLINGFAYNTLASPLNLNPDSYVIIMTMPNDNGDNQSILNTSVTTAPQIAYVNSEFGTTGATLAFPNEPGTFAEGMFGPNFIFTSQSASGTPEPGSLALFAGLGVVGVGFLRRRRAVQ